MSEPELVVRTVTDRRTPECQHDVWGGCYHCCDICNLDKHVCPGCGAEGTHAQRLCPDCQQRFIPNVVGYGLDGQ